jgi:glycosyltransferase involved in cell wall biosynthesis
MKILSIGTDSSVLEQDSSTARRVGEYGLLVDQYTVIVPAERTRKTTISDKVTVYGVGGTNKFMRLYGAWKKAIELLNRDGFTVITVQDQYYLALLAFLLARKFNIGLEIQNHGWEKNQGLRKKIAKFVLPRAQAVRTVSERIKQELIDDYGVAADKITVLPVHVNVQGVKARENYEPGENFIFCTVGRLVKVKNFELQLEALAIILKEHPNCELWIVGDGPNKSKLHTEINNLGIKERVKLLGHLNHAQTLALYYKIDTFLLTSLAEGWPQVIVEAAARARPIIMSDVGSAGELIIDGESGVVIPVNDKEALAKAMRKVIKDKDFRKRIGLGARKMAMELPAKERILQLYLKSWQKAQVRK